VDYGAKTCFREKEEKKGVSNIEMHCICAGTRQQNAMKAVEQYRMGEKDKEE
jgi:hypothetical protein